ncbi:nucleotidyltransferase family protein [Terrabacter sp. Soil810]|uniref:nucleotidyltransferase family protein n=1 Tax=Terrabacter sp. Soil810 TaxID=1736418 RepID=UPI00070F0879|nr:nucleotidyltransferase family protein [Terrabacter sp. Soil810]KRF40228.1 hypothetical protein ASG96_04795 [Terrabacter sp. Soil810]
MGVDDAPDLREALKTVAVALKRAGVPFALMGGYAAWARGGPEPDHDVDFLVADEDADLVAQHLADEGLDVVQPPEDWLFKVYADGAMVDIIHGPVGGAVHRAEVRRATPMDVLSVEMPVLEATELLVHKLNALDEHYCDLAKVLPVTRALREQVDWDRVGRETAGNDFAVTVLFLLRRLDIISG